MIIDIIIVLLIIFVSHVAQTITGFAGAMLSMPFLVLFLSINDSKVLLTIIGIAWSLYILITNYKDINLKFILVSNPIMLIGLIVSILIQKYISTNFLIIFMSLIIIFTALKNIFLKKVINVKWIDYMFYFFSGIMQGLILMGGPFLVMGASSNIKNKNEYRTTLSLIWLIMDVVLLVIFKFKNIINNFVFFLSVLSLIPLFISIRIGNILIKRIDNKKFGIIINILLIFSGLFILVKAF